MRRKNPIFYNALLLTFVNLLLRLAGTSFQVYISGRIGPAGIGLLQLVLSVGSLSMVAGMAGIRTATMYLTAEELGRGKAKHITWVLSGCFLYSILFSGSVAFLLYRFSPWISSNWIGNSCTVGALRLFAAFLPISCLCGVMTGYFTAANRIRTLAMIEVAEQLVSMAVTVLALTFWAQEDAGKACQAVILGSCAGGCLTLICLILLRKIEQAYHSTRIPIAKRIANAALPLAVADITKAGINTAENLMVPKRLAIYHLVTDPLAAFGTVSGMVFPVLMFPACILFGLAELLIPELARCNAAGSGHRISYLVKKSLRISMLYGVFFSGIIFLLSDKLCMSLYRSSEAGHFLRMYALLIPILYCDTVTDAMTKGLGQQKICVRYNILTSVMDIIFLYFLLPEYGMTGYYISFLITHLLNFILSLRRLLKITGEHLFFYIPAFTAVSMILAVCGAATFSSGAGKVICYTALMCSLLYLLKIISREDILWMKGLISKK